MERQEFEVLRARVERLERRMRMVVAGWVVSVAVVVLLGVAVQQAVSQPEVLRARRIEVLDAAGRVRARLGVDNFESGLSLHDNAGRVRARYGASGLSLRDGQIGVGLVASVHGSYLVFQDDAGQRRISLGIDPFRGRPPALRLYDEAGRERVELGYVTWESFSLWGLGLSDATGRGHVRLGVFPDGDPEITLRNAAGRVLFRAP